MGQQVIKFASSSNRGRYIVNKVYWDCNMFCWIAPNMCIFTTLCTSFINNQQGTLNGVSTGSEFCQVFNINPLKLNYGMHFQDVWFLIRLLTSQINKTSIHFKKVVGLISFIIHSNVSVSYWLKSPLPPILHNLQVRLRLLLQKWRSNLENQVSENWPETIFIFGKLPHSFNT